MLVQTCITKTCTRTLSLGGSEINAGQVCFHWVAFPKHILIQSRKERQEETRDFHTRVGARDGV